MSFFLIPHSLLLAIRGLHNGLMILSAVLLGVQFRRLNNKLTLALKGHSMPDISTVTLKTVQEHWRLTCLVERLNKVMGPSNLLVISSNMIAATLLISFVMADKPLEAPLGWFVVNSAMDGRVYIIYGVGACYFLLVLISAGIYLNIQV